MSPAELATAKEQLLAMPDRMGSMFDEAKAASFSSAVNKIVKAIEADDLAGAQSLYDATMQIMMSDFRGRSGGGRPSGGE